MYNPFSLEGKTVLVTGASSGIGRAVAVECSRMGATVVLTARNEERLIQTLNQCDGENNIFIVADLSDATQLENLVEQCPKLDGLINNAGITITLPVNFLNREKLAKIFEVNTFAPILLTQGLLKTKKLSKGSSIVFTDSCAGVFASTIGNSMYSDSKAAIYGFVKNAALDLESKSIRVNAVCPAMVETSILVNGAIDEIQLKLDMAKYPMKRYAKPEEVAYAMIYFLSSASSFTTGATLVIDGGLTLH
jgi:NAD(P)-dependent dehydrogenase (short-subunit alcohol dehydrogenase family)